MCLVVSFKHVSVVALNFSYFRSARNPLGNAPIPKLVSVPILILATQQHHNQLYVHFVKLCLYCSETSRNKYSIVNTVEQQVLTSYWFTKEKGILVSPGSDRRQLDKIQKESDDINHRKDDVIRK